jgi:hypothetical protein
MFRGVAAVSRLRAYREFGPFQVFQVFQAFQASQVFQAFQAFQVFRATPTRRVEESHPATRNGCHRSFVRKGAFSPVLRRTRSLPVALPHVWRAFPDFLDFQTFKTIYLCLTFLYNLLS